MPSFSRTANGDIYPMRFVKQDTTAGNNFKVLQAGAGDKPYGISMAGTRRVDYVTSATDNRAAAAGEDLNIYGPPDKDILLIIGGTVTAGDSLKSDANGQGVTTTTGGDWVGAIAMASGVSGQAIPVQVVSPTEF